MSSQYDIHVLVLHLHGIRKFTAKYGIDVLSISTYSIGEFTVDELIHSFQKRLSHEVQKTCWYNDMMMLLFLHCTILWQCFLEENDAALSQLLESEIISVNSGKERLRTS